MKSDMMLVWAVAQWKRDVGSRQMTYHHRRVLDTAWRKVIKKLGGNDIELLGPTHDKLLEEKRAARIKEYAEAIKLEVMQKGAE